MAAYRRDYDSRPLHADCQEPGSAPEPYAPYSSMGYLLTFLRQSCKFRHQCRFGDRVGAVSSPTSLHDRFVCFGRSQPCTQHTVHDARDIGSNRLHLCIYAVSASDSFSRFLALYIGRSDVTESLWSRYDRRFVGTTRYTAWS